MTTLAARSTVRTETMTVFLKLMVAQALDVAQTVASEELRVVAFDQALRYLLEHSEIVVVPEHGTEDEG